MSQTTILCADPDPEELAATAADLRRSLGDVEVVTAASLSTARELLRDRTVDCIVTEYEFPEGTGLDLTERVRDVEPDAGCFLYTTADPGVLRDDDHEATIVEYVNKEAPDAGEELTTLVDATVASRAQTSYPLPRDEDDRIAALEAYDFTGDDLRTTVEKMTDLAARHFDAPKASVNLVREHTQEYLACHGADWTPGEREDSICTYALVDDDPVTFVEDAREDPRFAENEELRRLDIRAYAGAALETARGLQIGTLCVYDDEPRSFTDDDAAFLGALADAVMDVIELHTEVSELRRDEAELESGGDRR